MIVEISVLTTLRIDAEMCIFPLTEIIFELSGEASKGSGGSGGEIPVASTAGRAGLLGRRKLLVTRPGK